jgi:lysophospholipase L1-like esterase
MKRRPFLRSLATATLAPSISGWAQSMSMNQLATFINVRANDPRIQYRGFANLRVSSKEAVGDRMVVDSPFRTDNPGARIRFETNASEVSLVLSYARLDSIKDRVHWASESMASVNGTDRIRIGRIKGNSGPQITKLDLHSIESRVIEVTLPYADTVTFLGLHLPKGAELFQMKPESLPRYVAYGDSITQGFQATNVVDTYPTRLARNQKWDLINMGFGSRRLTAPDGAVLARLKPNILTVLIGVNDCLQQKPLDRFTADLIGFITEFRRSAPQTPVFWITPLPIVDPARWKNSERLDSYREAITATITRLAYPQIQIIPGTDLIDSDPKLFGDGLHPNADGFQMIATRLAAILPKL